MRFTIRDLLLVTVIAALGTGWCVERYILRKELVELRQGPDFFKWKSWCLEGILRERGVTVDYQEPSTFIVTEGGYSTRIDFNR